jgi:hypothetical protein
LVDWTFYHFKIDFNDYFYRKKDFGADNDSNEARVKAFKNDYADSFLLWQQILFWMDLQNNDDAVCDSDGEEFYHLLFIIY